MGLVGIHDPDVLHCFNGLIHCPWCGKEGQNEGTVVNHLWTVHYRLSLVCNKCYNYPSTSSDTLCCHGQQNCQPSGRETPTSQLGQSNCQQRQAELICLNWESEQRSPEELASLGLPYWGHPPPIGTALEENQLEKVPPTNTQHPVTCFPTHLDQEAAFYSGMTQDDCQQHWTL